MHTENEGVVATLMSLPIFQAEWVLYLLIGLSVLSVMVMLERTVYYLRRRVDAQAVRTKLVGYLDDGDLEGAVRYLDSVDSLQTNVVAYGLRDCALGPDSVEDLLAGALTAERAKYEKRLTVLATIGSNAPFIGLFGTVLGIIRAFQDLSSSGADASSAVMAGVSEALVATAVGLVVAIPAVVAYNAFKAHVKGDVASTQLLSRTVLAFLKGESPVGAK